MPTQATKPGTQPTTARCQQSVSVPSTPFDIRGFEPCLDALLRSLRFAQLPWDQRREKAKVLSAFADSWNQLSIAATSDLHRMVVGTFEASADDLTTAKVIDIETLATRDTERLLQHSPVLPDELERTLRTAHAADNAQGFRQCGEALGKQAAHVINRYRYALNELRECGLAGDVTFGDHECEFTHVRTELSDEELDRAEESSDQTQTHKGVFIDRIVKTTTTRSEATVETTTTLRIHRHLISYPEIHPAPTPLVPTPDRIEKHVSCVPRFMLPVYITGELIDVHVETESLGSRKDAVVRTSQDTRFERQLNRRNLKRAGAIAGMTALTIAALPLIAVGAAALTVCNDPALVVGNGKYVLSGWLPEEVPVTRRFQLKRG